MNPFPQGVQLRQISPYYGPGPGQPTYNPRNMMPSNSNFPGGNAYRQSAYYNSTQPQQQNWGPPPQMGNQYGNNSYAYPPHPNYHQFSQPQPVSVPFQQQQQYSQNFIGRPAPTQNYQRQQTCDSTTSSAVPPLVGNNLQQQNRVSSDVPRSSGQNTSSTPSTNPNPNPGPSQPPSNNLDRGITPPTEQQRTVPESKRLGRIYTGEVTSLFDEIGFVGPDIIFHTSKVTSPVFPKVGDYVFVKARALEGMPWKWNCKDVQVLDKKSGIRFDQIYIPVESESQDQVNASISPAARCTPAPPDPPILSSRDRDRSRSRSKSKNRRSHSRSRSNSRSRSRNRHSRRTRSPAPANRSRLAKRRRSNYSDRSRTRSRSYDGDHKSRSHKKGKIDKRRKSSASQSSESRPRDEPKSRSCKKRDHEQSESPEVTLDTKAGCDSSQDDGETTTDKDKVVIPIKIKDPAPGSETVKGTTTSAFPPTVDPVKTKCDGLFAFDHAKFPLKIVTTAQESLYNPEYNFEEVSIASSDGSKSTSTESNEIFPFIVNTNPVVKDLPENLSNDLDEAIFSLYENPEAQTTKVFQNLRKDKSQSRSGTDDESAKDFRSKSKRVGTANSNQSTDTEEEPLNTIAPLVAAKLISPINNTFNPQIKKEKNINIAPVTRDPWTLFGQNPDCPTMIRKMKTEKLAEVEVVDLKKTSNKSDGECSKDTVTETEVPNLNANTLLNAQIAAAALNWEPSAEDMELNIGTGNVSQPQLPINTQVTQNNTLIEKEKDANIAANASSSGSIYTESELVKLDETDEFQKKSKLIERERDLEEREEKIRAREALIKEKEESVRKLFGPISERRAKHDGSTSNVNSSKSGVKEHDGTGRDEADTTSTFVVHDGKPVSVDEFIEKEERKKSGNLDSPARSERSERQTVSSSPDRTLRRESMNVRCFFCGRRHPEDICRKNPKNAINCQFCTRFGHHESICWHRLRQERRNRGASGTRSSETRSDKSNSPSPPTCEFCGQRGHEESECEDRPDPTQAFAHRNKKNEINLKAKIDINSKPKTDISPKSQNDISPSSNPSPPPKKENLRRDKNDDVSQKKTKTDSSNLKQTSKICLIPKKSPRAESGSGGRVKCKHCDKVGHHHTVCWFRPKSHASGGEQSPCRACGKTNCICPNSPKNHPAEAIKNSTRRIPKNAACYECGELGHIGRVCPKRLERFRKYSFKKSQPVAATVSSEEQGQAKSQKE